MGNGAACQCRGFDCIHAKSVSFGVNTLAISARAPDSPVHADNRMGAGAMMVSGSSGGTGQEAGGMTPSLAFAISLIYCVTVDRDVDAHEVGQLISAFGGKVGPDLIEVGADQRDLFRRAVDYVRTRKSDDFLAEATPILTETQRLCILLNMVDSALADSKAEPEERKLLAKFQRAFGISDERFRPFFEVILLKNDRGIFKQADPHTK
jgi:uncharacterized tellurite resistance protein B-like protein